MSAGERLAGFGLALPPGHTLHAVSDRPDLWRPVGAVNESVWPEFMLNFPVAAGTALPAEWASHAKQPTHPYAVDPADVAENRDDWLREWSDVTSR